MVKIAQRALVALLLLHFLWRLIFPTENNLRDLLLYNLIWVVALLILISAPLSVDRITVAALALAVLTWGAGSLISSIDEVHNAAPRFTFIAQVGYSLFYPLLLIAIPRIDSSTSKLQSLELLDAVIFGLGFTSIATVLLITLVFPANSLLKSEDFFTIFYPVGDLALLLTVVTQLVTRGARRPLLIAGCGVLAFAFSDIYYLWLALHHRYAFGSLADNGWLVSIVLFAFIFSDEKQMSPEIKPIHPALVAISIFISPILLAISALNPALFPLYVVGLLVANLFLGFIRMSTALRQAHTLHDERVLARTDELTGLANRRRLLSEIDTFSEVEGALLLLDLDGFKPINDCYGHDVGDLILREVSKRFIRVLPHGSLIARLGGDEFGVLLKGSYEENLESAHALRATLSYPFAIDGESLTVGVSIGIVQNDGAGDLLKRADSAMYRAKQMGTGVAPL